MSSLALKESIQRLDPYRIREDFPILKTTMQGQPLVYLDSAASAQKPRQVIEAHKGFYEHDYANIHRGIYELSQRATAMHDEARRKVQGFIGAADWREIVFTRNATEAINLVAFSYVEPRLSEGDEILITEMDHHANIVPWQLIAERRGAHVVPAPIDDDGNLLMDRFEALITKRTKFIALPWISNVLGTVNSIDDIISLGHARGIPVLLDAAQAVHHRTCDVQAIDCDFLVFSGHKIYGPSGTGVLYGKASLLEEMRPYQGGGDMIDRVSFEGTTFNEIPFRFEAGTPDIAGIVALGAAVDYIQSIGMDAIEAHEAELLAYALRAIKQVPGIRLLGEPIEKCSVIAFGLEGAHPQDIGTMLDLDGVAIRTGHHCAQPLHARFGLTASARASLGIYNTRDDIDVFIGSLKRAQALFS